MTNIYVVVAVGDESTARIKTAIDNANFISKYDGYAPSGLWFVATPGTARDVSAAVGLIRTDANPNPPTGAAIGVGEYYGYASKDLWAWMKDQKTA